MQRQRPLRYPKKFTVKAWNKFDLTQQDILCCRYDIILTDYKTKKEKIFSVMDKFSPKNINKGIKVMNRGLKRSMSKYLQINEDRVNRPCIFFGALVMFAAIFIFVAAYLIPTYH